MSVAVKELKKETPVTARETRVLVVDDSAIDRRLAGGIVESSDGLTVLYAGDGLEALALLEREAPAAVVTDLQMRPEPAGRP